jgi:predicted house-cleaning noncanonical NTP pyrophosphatase (MazG superfamily)
MSICIDRDLLEVVDELKSRRQFSKFIQDSLRSQRVIIQSESLQHNKKQIQDKINELIAQSNLIDSKLEEVKSLEDKEFHINDLVDQYHCIVADLSTYKYLEDIPVQKWPKPIRDLHYSKLSTINALKQAGFDLSTLNKNNNHIN